MPGAAGSSWYYLRYIDPHNDNEIGEPELLKHWMPVDHMSEGQNTLLATYYTLECGVIIYMIKEYHQYQNHLKN